MHPWLKSGDELISNGAQKGLKWNELVINYSQLGCAMPNTVAAIDSEK